MRSTVLRRLLAAPLLLWALSPAVAEDDAKPDTPTSKLARAVLGSPVDLRMVASRSEMKKGAALRAAFALDTRGRLLARILVRSAAGEPSEYEEWSGHVHDECWTPRRRLLVEPSEVAEARRVDALMRQGKRSLHNGITSSRGPQYADKRWPGIAVSIEPAVVDGVARFVSLVAHEDRLRRVTQAREAGEILTSVLLPSDPDPVEPDSHPRVAHMPALSVPEGIWFFADKPPALAALRGSPVLIAVSDPG